MSANKEEKTFTQAEVNAMMANNKKTLQREREDLERRVTELTALGEAARARVGELEAHLESARLSRTQLEQRHTETVASHRKAMNHAAVLDALNTANMAAGAEKYVVPEFFAECELDYDADGRIAKAGYGGQQFPKLADAAREFMRERPLFRKADPGGSGHPMVQHGAPFAIKKPDVTEQDSKALVNDGWREGAA